MDDDLNALRSENVSPKAQSVSSVLRGDPEPEPPPGDGADNIYGRPPPQLLSIPSWDTPAASNASPAGLNPLHSAIPDSGARRPSTPPTLSEQPPRLGQSHPAIRQVLHLARLTDKVLLARTRLEQEQQLLTHCREFLRNSTQTLADRLLHGKSSSGSGQKLSKLREAYENDFGTLRRQDTEVSELGKNLSILEFRLQGKEKDIRNILRTLLDRLQHLPSDFDLPDLDISESDTDVASSSDTPTLLADYYERKGDVGVYRERLHELDIGHDEGQVYREMLADRGEYLSVDDAEFERLYVEQRKEIEDAIASAELDAQELAEKCRIAGLEIIAHRARSSSAGSQRTADAPPLPTRSPRTPKTRHSLVESWLSHASPGTPEQPGDPYLTERIPPLDYLIPADPDLRAMGLSGGDAGAAMLHSSSHLQQGSDPGSSKIFQQPNQLSFEDLMPELVNPEDPSGTRFERPDATASLLPVLGGPSEAQIERPDSLAPTQAPEPKDGERDHCRSQDTSIESTKTLERVLHRPDAEQTQPTTTGALEDERLVSAQRSDTKVDLARDFAIPIPPAPKHDSGLALAENRRGDSSRTQVWVYHALPFGLRRTQSQPSRLRDPPLEKRFRQALDQPTSQPPKQISNDNG